MNTDSSEERIQIRFLVIRAADIVNKTSERKNENQSMCCLDKDSEKKVSGYLNRQAKRKT